MAKGRIVALVIIGIMLLTCVMPQVAGGAYTPADKPVNVAPYDNATEIGPSFVFRMSVPDPAPDEYYGYQVQYRTPDGTYALPLFDSGFQPSGEEAVYPAGAFDYGKTYYWRVRVQDNLGYWSDWSDETSFTVIVNSPPSQPENFEPDNNATAVSLPLTLQTCEFRDPNASELVLGEADSHAASQWQVTATSDNYVSPVYGSGRVTADLASISVPVGTLAENTKYYWHVRYQDSYGNWSAYSPQTSFTTGTTTPASVAVQQPVNVSPFGGATEISPDQKLKTSSFQGAAGRTHFASRWQVASSAGAFSSSLFDSGIDLNNKVEIAMPVGLLDYEKTYYWHVKYQDDTGAWSAWSEETLFTLVGNLPPSQPRNLEPLDEKTDVVVIPVLKASDFSDPDTSAYVALTDSHAASQWQVTATAGNYSDNICAWNSGVASPTTSAIVSAGKLAAGTKYFWHVRYQDSHENWSGYSAETWFTTKALSAPVASFSADKTSVTAGTELVMFTDNSTPAGEITAWSWSFGDGTTENWTLLTRPSNGQISHKYTIGGTQTVKLTVTNAAATDEEMKENYVLVHAKPEASIGVLTAPAKTGQEVTFKDNSSPTEDITSWEWQFDDGTTEQWTAAQRQAANGQITHVFKKAGQHTVSLTVAGALGESYYNKPITVTGGGGLHFGLWMIGVALAAVVVVAGVAYLVRARKGK